MKVMHRMLAQTAVIGIDQVAALVKGWRLHAALHTFHQGDVFQLEYLVDELDGF